jgi:L-threonylcarbamoyladenylate synthase
MAREPIEAIVGPLAAADAGAPAAPGTLASHYAPRAIVMAVEPDEVPAEVRRSRGKVAVLAPRSAFGRWGKLAVVEYPLPDDVAGMARALYAALRDLDASGVDVVIAALPPAAGLGEAVGDRLRRAAGPRKP